MQKISVTYSELEDDGAEHSGSEYLPSDVEDTPRKCCLCSDEVFIACPDCLVFLCYDHRQTDCSEHVQTVGISPVPDISSDRDEQSVGSLRIPDINGDKSGSRRRKRNPAKWHRVAAKRNREMGQAYVSATSKLVPQKVVCSNEVLCRPNSKRRCSTKVSLSQRQSIFYSFYKLDGNSQNSYLFKSISPVTPTVQRVEAKSHRTMSFRYHVSVDGEVTGNSCVQLCSIAPNH